jgi:hypothetical protein
LEVTASNFMMLHVISLCNVTIKMCLVFHGRLIDYHVACTLIIAS